MNSKSARCLICSQCDVIISCDNGTTIINSCEQQSCPFWLSTGLLSTPSPNCSESCALVLSCQNEPASAYRPCNSAPPSNANCPYCFYNSSDAVPWYTPAVINTLHPINPSITPVTVAITVSSTATSPASISTALPQVLGQGSATSTLLYTLLPLSIVALAILLAFLCKCSKIRKKPRSVVTPEDYIDVIVKDKMGNSKTRDLIDDDGILSKSVSASTFVKLPSLPSFERIENMRMSRLSYNMNDAKIQNNQASSAPGVNFRHTITNPQLMYLPRPVMTRMNTGKFKTRDPILSTKDMSDDMELLIVENTCETEKDFEAEVPKVFSITRGIGANKLDPIQKK